jgi:shikimate kinase
MIYLIGFMGAGKTTLGKYLSQRMGIPFFDTDAHIVKTKGLDINSIFLKFGEAYFRDLEKKALRELSCGDGVVSTGGGIIKNIDNVQWMKSKGVVIYLYAPFEELYSRIKDSDRPLIREKSYGEINEVFLSREKLYEGACHFIINTYGQEIPNIIDEIELKLKGVN